VDKLYYFGIDGGGTHSRLAVTNREGRILGRAEAGSTNIYSMPKDAVFENLRSLLDSCLQAAGLRKEDLGAGCVGSAGLGREKEQRVFQGFFDSFLGTGIPVKLCGDGEILLCGGLEDLEGYCLIAGTGSTALGRSKDGRLVRAGGLGYMLGDEGSAAWIGKTVITRILRSLEGRDLPSFMLEAILEKTGLSQSEDLIRYVHIEADKARVAALAPLVTEAARSADPLALDILRTGAAEMVLLVRSVLDRSPWIENRTLVLAGGVIEHDEIITEKLRGSLAAEFPRLKITEPRGNALEGACLLAASIAGHLGLSKPARNDRSLMNASPALAGERETRKPERDSPSSGNSIKASWEAKALR
jgi:N-acetylglucosamine kinase-like BadF-type ATPase